MQCVQRTSPSLVSTLQPPAEQTRHAACALMCCAFCAGICRNMLVTLYVKCFIYLCIQEYVATCVRHLCTHRTCIYQRLRNGHVTHKSQTLACTQLCGVDLRISSNHPPTTRPCIQHVDPHTHTCIRACINGIQIQIGGISHVSSQQQRRRRGFLYECEQLEYSGAHTQSISIGVYVQTVHTAVMQHILFIQILVFS